MESRTARSQRIQILAGVNAYEVEAVSNAIADSPGYLRLQQIRALVSIAENPSIKIYFIDPNGVRFPSSTSTGNNGANPEGVSPALPDRPTA